MKYYIFKYMTSRGATVYWNGNFSATTGDPTSTVDTKRAACYTTAREAYNAAGEFKKLDWWKVGKRR